MCDFLSGCIGRTDPSKIWIHNGLSHSQTAEHFKLKPETYREFEWASNEPSYLDVRTLHDPFTCWEYKQAILKRFPTRAKMIKWWLSNLPQTFHGNLLLYSCPSSLLKNIKLPKHIKGELSLPYMNVSGITFPETVSGKLSLPFCRGLDKINLPRYVGGSMDVRYCDLKNVILPKIVRYDLYICEAKNIKKATYPTRLGYLSATDTQISQLKKVKLPKVVRREQGI